jgi:hypothetical protein
MEKIDFNLAMAEKQLAALSAFPSFHPKRKEYESGLHEVSVAITPIYFHRKWKS